MTKNYTMKHAQAKANKLAAQEAGNNKYMGTACPKGHSGLRFVISNNCVDCTLATLPKLKVRRFPWDGIDMGTDMKQRPSTAPGYDLALQHGARYYKPTDLKEYCPKKHDGRYRTRDRQCMSCLAFQKRQIARRNRARYIPVWLR